MAKGTWLKTTEHAVLDRVQRENLGQSEIVIKAKTKHVFNVLRDNGQLEYSGKFYDLRTSPSRGSIEWKVDHTAEAMKVNVSHDVVLLSTPTTGDTKAEQREDDGTTSDVKVALIPKVEITSATKKFVIAISVATTKTPERVDMSITEPSNVGATYGSLLLTDAALECRSEMESESAVGMSVAGMSL
ncbi:hypothetical protein CBR_g31713 [Chara braunii]|uniref:Uncharacterized protein n=1 Tax=Chara braunii TaxID=69332 RepID=A0A388JY19_CHABU|nr:hypothetical protein CBR_g31713 [Chara braunii]|eukprot:GBG62696.1 hypothetical protein CBR_g31713 [Chara braunii]